MDRKEAIKRFVNRNMKHLSSHGGISKESLKRMKAKFFVDELRNSVGVPKDKELAYEAVDNLLETGYISKPEDLTKVLGLPFFRDNIHDATVFTERLSMKEHQVGIDLKRLRESQYQTSLREEIKSQILREEIEDIEAEKNKRISEYLSLPSVLDEKDFDEPLDQNEIASDQPFLPWYKKLNLVGDPFPSQLGLDKIDPSMYDKVILKTTVFEKYVYFTNQESAEVFKDTMFLGIFGSGKTTLFEYLKKPLIDQHIHPISITLVMEQDFRSFMISFRKELLLELQRTYEALGAAQLHVEGNDLDEKIRQGFLRMSHDYPCKGFVIFVDDLHKYKNSEEFEVVKEFLNNLQIYKANLRKSLVNIDFAFYISGLPEWNQTIGSDPRYSGSYSRRETMPPITAESGYEMLNLRLHAFSSNPDKKAVGGGITLEYVKKIYRGLQNNREPITFRSFISAVQSEFEKGNFSILEANPVHIPESKLQEIKSRLEADQDLKSRLNSLVYGGGIQRRENRIECLKCLIHCYLEHGISENDKYFAENLFYLQRLSKARLIEKVKIGPSFKWMLCKPLFDQNQLILREMNYSLEDYLLQAYKLVGPTTQDQSKYHQEIEDLRQFLSAAIPDAIQVPVRRSIEIHSQMLEEVIEKAAPNLSPTEIVDKCIESLGCLTNAIITLDGIERPVTNITELVTFWDIYWTCPAEVFEFMRLTKDGNDYSDRIWYICRNYRSAFLTLSQFLRDEISNSRYFQIVPSGLTKLEVDSFHKIRELWVKQKHVDVLKAVHSLNQRKLRNFLFNIYRLHFGNDMSRRLSHLDAGSRKYILQNINKLKNDNYQVGMNEFEQLNRGNYKNFMISLFNHEVGDYNWQNLFRRIFAPWSETQLRDFLSDFAEFDINVTHEKESALNAQVASRVYQYVLNSMDFIKAINNGYVKLLTEGVERIDTGGSPKYVHYVSFPPHLPHKELEAIYISSADTESMHRQMKRETVLKVDLSDYERMELLSNLTYPAFFVLISVVLHQTEEQTKRSGIKVKIGRKHGCTLDLICSDG